jgi:hypothetical protein
MIGARAVAGVAQSVDLRCCKPEIMGSQNFDIRYQDFRYRFSTDLPAFCRDVIGLKPAADQAQLFRDAGQDVDRVSVPNGMGSVAAESGAAIAVWHLVCFPGGATFVVHKHGDVGLIGEVERMLLAVSRGSQGWVLSQPMIVVSQKNAVHAEYLGLRWSINMKSGRGAPESFAGICRLNQLWLVDRAHSGMSDAAFRAVEGNIDGGSGRMILFG